MSRETFDITKEVSDTFVCELYELSRRFSSFDNDCVCINVNEEEFERYEQVIRLLCDRHLTDRNKSVCVYIKE
jgi:hypothetical protein